MYFSQEDLEGQEEGKLSLELHLYDEKEDKEIAVLEPVEMKARLGAKHIVQVTGSKEEDLKPHSQCDALLPPRPHPLQQGHTSSQ